MQETNSRVSPPAHRQPISDQRSMGLLCDVAEALNTVVMLSCRLDWFPAIERNLESEEQERVSADMRIRKSQVNDVQAKSWVAVI